MHRDQDALRPGHGATVMLLSQCRINKRGGAICSTLKGGVGCPRTRKEGVLGVLE